MKRIFFLFSILIAFLYSQGQSYNNEWIDYNKTYYKFRVGETGLYRITQSTLTTLGIGNTPAEFFQLWRNGQQVPIFTSAAIGVMSSNGFIEFWGERNDGKPDKQLYKDPSFQLSEKNSFYTDTAAFFLTINPGGNNMRIQQAVNNVAGNSLSADSYFMHTAGIVLKDVINPGYFVDAGEYLYSSSYDQGENWVGWDIYPDKAYSNTLKLHLFQGGPKASFKINLSGNAINTRRYRIRINKDSISGNQLDYLNYERVEVPNIDLSIFTGDTANIEIKNQSIFQFDRMVVSQYSLTYPRKFNFEDAKNFEFELAANSTGNYIEITNFNNSGIAPILYDITNGKRYIGDISNPSLIKFALAPSFVNRKLILISLDNSNVTQANSFVTRKFKNYYASANQGDYIIISNPILYNGAGGSNPVDDYRAYRSSVAGGSFNAKIYDIDELVDQFGFGIKKHPSSVRNFLRWSRANFFTPLKFVFLIGHGVVYDQCRYYESNPEIDKLNLVPTFGSPASDVLLSAELGQQIPITPISRLSAISGVEVADYLVKVKQYELAQQSRSPFIKDKAWMKNVVHAVGGNEPSLVAELSGYFNKYNQIIADTLYGAKITTFKKSSTEAIQLLTNQQLDKLFAEGISQITYFGHSSTTVLDFNLDEPEKYNNQGKYPIFIAMGCLAGNFFNYNPARFYVKETLSEKFLFAKERGGIAFLATSHYGIPFYLDAYNTNTYKAESRTHYGKSFGEIIRESIVQTYSQLAQNNYLARLHTEQNTMHGDPAIKPNYHLKPDYVIEDPLVKVTPSFLTISEKSFKIDAKFLNIGSAVSKNIIIEIKRQFPAGNIVSVYKTSLPGIRFQDSINVILPINPVTDKGLNKLIVTVDADNAVDELYETNNTVTKDIFIYEDDIKTVYPLNYAIVNKQNIKLQASTANPLSTSKQYRIEIDTTELYTSSTKQTQTLSSIGGLLEFAPGLNFSDSTVYYWRVSQLDNQGNAVKWSNSSFVFLANSEPGFNQSHFYQQTKSTTERVNIDSSSRKWTFKPAINNLFVRTAIYPTGGTYSTDYNIVLNNVVQSYGGCNYDELIFNVYDGKTFKPMSNDYSGGTGLYGSFNAVCGPLRNYNFQYLLNDSVWRRKAMNFLENVVPDGSYVVVRTNSYPYDGVNTYSNVWKEDTVNLGAGVSLYHTLKNQGFSNIDEFNSPKAFVFVYKKNGQAVFAPQSIFTSNIYDRIIMNVDCPSPDSLGFISSPVFGAAKQWKQLKWRGSTTDPLPGDEPTVDIIGVNNNGTETKLISNLTLSQQDYDISTINASQYPFLKLRMRNADSINQTAYQLRYWRLTYTPVPEGALAPNIFFQMKDTFEIGEPLDFKIAFKNISDANFDSLKAKIIITDANNVSTVVPLSRFKPLLIGDTLHIRTLTVTQNLVGFNSLYLDVNPDNDQPEQFHFNNFIYKSFFVKGDKINPLMDVTFDGMHILNRDIVSPKPHILVKLKDENKWMVLNDTSAIKLQVRFPDGSLHPYYFSKSDTLKFTPPGNAPNNDNTATIDFLPNFSKDGNYELIVSGKDRSGNTAGNLEYKVGFQVVNKPMISNMLNYPNPFTTSTAFVFTITGSEVPQNIKIQILTVTGRTVREITKEELGLLHIGRNITEYKWDGTDQFGQKLANGVYLYRVVTNLNGHSLDKYKSADDNTDQYFNKGYGKMYLMR